MLSALIGIFFFQTGKTLVAAEIFSNDSGFVRPPQITLSSHQPEVFSAEKEFFISWEKPTEAEKISGYSLSLNIDQSVEPDNVLDLSENNFSKMLDFGVFYFKIKAINELGEAGEITSFGPIVVSDGEVLIKNSTIENVFNEFRAPALAEENNLKIFNQTKIFDSAISLVELINQSVVLASSTISNSSIDNSFVSSSKVVGSSLNFSTTTDSTISGGKLSQSFVDNSSLALSNSENSIIRKSNLNGTTIKNSDLAEVIILGNASSISDASFASTIMTNAFVAGDFILSGIVTLPNGNTQIISKETLLSEVVNFPPRADFLIKPNGNRVLLIDKSSDKNEGGSLGKFFTYQIDFGDGVVEQKKTSSTKILLEHTYVSSGDYLIRMSITDEFGAKDEKTLKTKVSYLAGEISVADFSEIEDNNLATDNSVGQIFDIQHLPKPKDLKVSFVDGGENGLLASVLSSEKEIGKENSPIKINQNLALGMSGEDVLALQNYYNQHGFGEIPLTGYFGQITFSATKKYQKSRFLPETGLVGKLTREVLSSEPIEAEKLNLRRLAFLAANESEEQANQPPSVSASVPASSFLAPVSSAISPTENSLGEKVGEQNLSAEEEKKLTNLSASVYLAEKSFEESVPNQDPLLKRIILNIYRFVFE